METGSDTDSDLVGDEYDNCPTVAKPSVAFRIAGASISDYSSKLGPSGGYADICEE